MSRGPDKFAETTEKLCDIERHVEGKYLHEYDAVLEATDEPVRVITLAHELADNEDAIDAFAHVTDKWYTAHTHPNIVSIVERATTPRSWIGVTHPHHQTLEDVQSQLTATEIQTVVADTAEALRTLGVYNAVHATLSPDDILVSPDGNDTTCQVGGLGLAHAVNSALGALEPTPYTAPELLEDSDKPTALTDVSQLGALKTEVYGLGAITYFALTGHPPVNGSDLKQAIRDGPSVPPSAYNEAIVPQLDDVVMQALSPRPADRQNSPNAFKRAYLSAFDPNIFEIDEDTDESESKTAELSAADDADEDEPTPDESDQQMADDTEDEDESTKRTRRATLTLFGLGAVGTIGGLNWYFSRDQSTPTGQPPAPPAPPTASISVTPANPAVDEQVSFSAAESTTGEGISLTTYEWAIGNDAEFSAGEETLTQSFRDSGEQTVRLRITDSQDRTTTATTTVTVESLSDGAPMFQYNAANTGTNPDETGPQTSIGEQWSYQTGDQVRSSPAVVDGIVYIGSRDNNVYALSADDGTEQWSFDTGGDVRSSPAVVDGTVYIGSADENVYALSADDGSEQWSYQTGGDVETSVAVIDGTVYVGSNGYNDNYVYALSAEDGTEQWSYQTAGEVRGSPAVANGTVYVGSRSGYVYALSAEDGTEQWSYQTGDDVWSSPAVVDSTVYVGSRDNKVYALSADDGTEQWSFDTSGWVRSSPAVVDGTVYIGSEDENVYALSAEDGTLQWSFETGTPVEASPAVIDGSVYVGSGGMYALSAEDGTEQWSIDIPGWVESSPAVVDGAVFVGVASGYDGYVYALSE